MATCQVALDEGIDDWPRAQLIAHCKLAGIPANLTVSLNPGTNQPLFTFRETEYCHEGTADSLHARKDRALIYRDRSTTGSSPFFRF